MTRFLAALVLSLVLTLPAAASAECVAPPVATCPDDATLNCEPYDSESCPNEGLREPLAGVCLADGTPCLGCRFCDFECPVLTCDPLPSPCDLVVDQPYRLNGKTCPGCAFCKQCPAPLNCAPIDPACPTESIVTDRFPFETITCPGCPRCGVTWTCGDGVVEGPEQCDPGPDVAGDCCNAACRFVGGGEACRPSTGACDTEEQCSGDSESCPADVARPDGTPCGEGDLCSGGNRCEAAACVSFAPLPCDDDDPCTADSCDPGTGCENTPIDDCPAGASDAGTSDAGADPGSPDAGATDGGSSPDAGGTVPEPEMGGCECGSVGTLPFAIVALALRRRRSRAR